jgi:hypothetical protein
MRSALNGLRCQVKRVILQGGRMPENLMAEVVPRSLDPICLASTASIHSNLLVFPVRALQKNTFLGIIPCQTEELPDTHET